MPIVKVQRALASSEANPPFLVYSEGHRRLRHIHPPDAVTTALGDDDVGYFDAEWKRGEWVLSARVKDQDW